MPCVEPRRTAMLSHPDVDAAAAWSRVPGELARSRRCPRPGVVACLRLRRKEPMADHRYQVRARVAVEELVRR